MGKFWAGFIVGFVLLPLCLLCYLVFGFAPAATTAQPIPLERLIADTALSSRISREGTKREPENFTVKDLVEGAEVYSKNCSVCHGSYQKPAAAIGKAMYPQAPQLLTTEGMTNQPVDVTYWKIENGIRLTGMPSFASILQDNEKWNVSAMLSRLNTLPPEAQQALNAAAGVRQQGDGGPLQ